MSDVFISYVRATEREARQIAEALQGLGYAVWRDDQLPAHRDYSIAETDFSGPSMLVSCYTALGDGESARRAARTALARAEKVIAQDRSNGHAMNCGANALALLGEAERAREWMDRALLIDPDNLLIRYNFACALIAYLNDADAALQMLAPVMEQDPGVNVRYAKIDPDLDALRDDPRFQAMLAAAEARLSDR